MRRKSPNLIHYGDIMLGKYSQSQMRASDGRVDRRPEGYDTIGHRLKLAWGVFTGKYDALKWEYRQ